MTKKSTWAVPYFVFLVLFVVLPLLLIAVYAFTDNHGSFTLSNITAFFTEPKIVNSFLVSLEVALENTLICILIGYPAAYILADRKLNRSSLTAEPSRPQRSSILSGLAWERERFFSD